MNDKKNIDEQIACSFYKWKSNLRRICTIHELNVDNYNPEIIEDFFADGLTPKEAYKQLLSELELPQNDERN